MTNRDQSNRSSVCKVKLTKACETCRMKKLRCTGGIPCERCLRDAVECKYPPTKPSQNAAQLAKIKKQEQEIEHLKSKLREFESKTCDLPSLLHADDLLDDEPRVDVALVDYFFNNLYIHVPMFHRRTFTQNITDPNRQVSDFLRRSFVAFVTHFASRDPSYPNVRPTEEFAKRSLEKAKQCLFKNYNVVSLEMVQSCALMSRASVAAGDLDLGWIFSGLMLRLATLLSLNWENEKLCENKLDYEIEEERRTWWVVYIINQMASSGARVPLIINLDFCNRPLPVIDSYYEAPNFSYALMLNTYAALSRRPSQDLLENQVLGDLGHYIRLMKVMSDVLMYSLRFSIRCGRLSRVDRLESSIPCQNAILSQHQWAYIVDTLSQILNDIPGRLRDNQTLINSLSSISPLSRQDQYHFSIFVIYNYCLLLLHIPSSMTLELPNPVVPWADHTLKPWVEAAKNVSLVADALVRHNRIPVWASSAFEAVLFLSSNIHLLELVIINDRICKSMSTAVSFEEREMMARERQTILTMLDINYRAMCLVEPLWKINEGVRLMFAHEMAQLGIPVPDIRKNKC